MNSCESELEGSTARHCNDGIVGKDIVLARAAQVQDWRVLQRLFCLPYRQKHVCFFAFLQGRFINLLIYYCDQFEKGDDYHAANKKDDITFHEQPLKPYCKT